MEEALPDRGDTGKAGGFRGGVETCRGNPPTHYGKDSQLDARCALPLTNGAARVAFHRFSSRFVAGRARRSFQNVSENEMAKSGFAKEHLRSFVERIERLEEEKKALADDIREVYSEAKGTGFDTKVMRQVVRLRKMESADRQEQEAMLDLYLNALGMRR